MPRPPLPPSGNTRRRRDLELEAFVRSVQLLTGQFEASDVGRLREQCREIAHGIPTPSSPAIAAIACAILVGVITRIAIANPSPPNVSVVLSSARLCGRLDLRGMAAVLEGWAEDATTCGTELNKYPQDYRVQRALLLIRERYSDPSLTLATLAADVHLSPWHLARLLAEHTGISFKVHLTETRLRHATKLLEQTFLSIKEITHCCGYGQLETFERAFKKHFGDPPTLWRARRSSTIRKKRQATAKIDD